MNLSAIDVPSEWEDLDFESITGTLLIIGAPSVGKSTFARFLFHKLNSAGRITAYLDGDPGQCELGPPTTMTATFHPEEAEKRMSGGKVWRYFVGATTPSGHMLPVLVGSRLLTGLLLREGADCVVFDTSGLVDPSKGGAALKQAKIDLLQANTVFAIQAEEELEYLLRPLRRTKRIKLDEIRPSQAAQPRSQSQRRKQRSRQYARYFADANPMTLSWPDYGVFPAPHFSLNRLLALEGSNGLVLDLGIVSDINRRTHEIQIFTPLDSINEIDTLRIGDVKVDPRNFNDQLIH